MYKLKPCPFCGGEALFYYNIENKCDYLFFIRCNSCNIRTPKTFCVTMEMNNYGQLITTIDERHKAVEFWNTRAEESEGNNV